MTDYSPERFDDYDPDAVKNIFGKDVSSKGDSNALDGYRRIYAEDMTLLRFDKERGQLTYTHIPGNTLVSVGGVKTCLEEIPAFYGTEYLVDKIHAILGVEIDTYVLLTPESAAAALDRIGEITYTVGCDMIYKDDERGIDINIKAGSQKLDGKKTVDMLRFDGYKSIGASRTSTALGYLKRFVNKIKGDFTYDELRDIIIEALDGNDVVTDFTKENAGEAIWLLSCAADLEIVSLDLAGQEQTVGSDKYFWIDEAQTLKKFEPYRKINAPDDIWD
jgi:anionic cell wall polymer biosynthesis LytR-Cps2A-Psr (LCP) family protein